MMLMNLMGGSDCFPPPLKDPSMIKTLPSLPLSTVHLKCSFALFHPTVPSNTFFYYLQEVLSFLSVFILQILLDACHIPSSH